MRRASAYTAVAATLALGAACVSLKRTPEARFFALRAVAEPKAAEAGAALRDVVGVMTVRLPGHIDRPQLVTWAGPDELRIDEFVRWAEPLDTGLTRVLAENLQALLPDRFVTRPPWLASTLPRARVVVELGVFGMQPNGEVKLEGRWALLPARGDLPRRLGSARHARGPLPHGPSGIDPAAEIEAMNELVAELARDIAGAVRALGEAEPAAPAARPPRP